MGVCICMLCIYTVHIQSISEKNNVWVYPKMGDSPKRWDTLVSHKPVCVKTLVPF